jgi:hypothetical protein
MKALWLVLLGLVAASPAAAQQAQQDAPADDSALQRERAIERCQANRGSDCESDAGLREWLLQERSREEAEAEGSRDVHQNAPRPTPQ